MSQEAPPLPDVTIDPPGFHIRVTPPHRLVDRVTAESDLFLIAHLGIAHIDSDTWRLSIGGLVERPRDFSLAELRRLPKRTIESFHHCAGDPTDAKDAKRLVGNVCWGGVDLAALLATCGMRSEATYLWAFGPDSGSYQDLPVSQFWKDMPLGRLREGGVLLAYELNGAPLTPERGFPLRLIVPGYYGTNDVKWLYRLELADRRASGVFTTILYNDPVPGPDGGDGSRQPLWEAPPESAIVRPEPNAVVHGEAVEIWGWAWAARGIARVEIGAGDDNWTDATLEPRRDWSWQRFGFRWSPPGPGTYHLRARATDNEGAVQPLADARNAIHSVTVTVAPRDPSIDRAPR
jgi:DMSO/TMAO reductase YedYZ molybdopterin-dependent catalytic subunit